MNISIITNFGCNKNCWYCIWKNHHLEKVKEKTDWNKLETFFQSYINILNPDFRKVSISGGGEPLYNYYVNVEWWDELFKLCRNYDIAIDIHTREKLYDELFWEKINKCVFSSDHLTQDKKFLDYVLKHTKLRISHVATELSSDKKIEEYINYKKNNNCQLTIKELSGFNDKGRYKEIRNKYSDQLYYLDDDDYNVYFMPNNTVKNVFKF